MAEADVIGNIDLTDDEYLVTQSLIRNKYRVDDMDGNVVLRAKQKLFKMKEEFPFVDADDNPIFTVKAQAVLDIAGDYTIFDASDEEPVAVLSKKFTLLKHVWKIRDPDTEEVWASIESRSSFVELLRNLSNIFALIPHKYAIETPDGEEIGEIAGQFSIRDKYIIRITDSGDVPKEALVASAIAVDALEGN